MQPKAYVIIPVRNRLTYTENCLAHLKRQTYADMEVIVVDDGSSDGTADIIRSKFPEVTLLHGNGQLWWLGAINLALRYIMLRSRDTDLVVFMNNDLIFGKSFIEVLVRAYEQHPRAIIGPVESIQGTGDIIHNGGVDINWWTARGKNLNGGRALREFPPGHTVKVSFVNGRGIMFPLRVFREVGMLDTRYVHMGDFEFGVRAKKHGYELLRIYDAVVYHYRDNPKGIEKPTYKWSDFRAYLTDERSYSNIRNIALNAILCTKNPLQGISYFIFDTIWHVGHFVKGVYFAKAQDGRP